jgi:hypothetical protein
MEDDESDNEYDNEYDDDDLRSIYERLRDAGVGSDLELAEFASTFTSYPHAHPELVWALTEHTGSPRRAAAVLSLVPALRHLDVAGILLTLSRETTIRGLIGSSADLARIVDQIVELEPSRQKPWLVAAAQHFGLDPAARFAIRDRSALAIDLVRLTLPPGDLQACEAILSLGLPLPDAATLLALLGHNIDPMNSEISVPSFYARKLANESMSVARALPLIAPSVPPNAWLALFKECGLTPSFAVLQLREVYACTTAVEVVRHMVAAHFVDGLLEALQKNGFATSTALASLAKHGWHIDRMVQELLGRGLLASDVRDCLIDLGLAKPAIRDVLLRHVDLEVVDLVAPR